MTIHRKEVCETPPYRLSYNIQRTHSPLFPEEGRCCVASLQKAAGASVIVPNIGCLPPAAERPFCLSTGGWLIRWGILSDISDRWTFFLRFESGCSRLFIFYCKIVTARYRFLARFSLFSTLPTSFNRLRVAKTSQRPGVFPEDSPSASRIGLRRTHNAGRRRREGECRGPVPLPPQRAGGPPPSRDRLPSHPPTHPIARAPPLVRSAYHIPVNF